MTALPEKSTHHLVEELNQMIRAGEINDFLLRRCRQEAEKLKGIDNAAAFTLLGMIACIEDDEEEMHLCHKNALRYSDKTWCRMQYAVSSINCEDYDNAEKQANIIHENDPSNLHALDILIASAALSGKKEEFIMLTGKWKSTTGEEHPMVNFPEDNEKLLLKVFDAYETIAGTQPDRISEPDPDFMKLADELTKGVEAD